MIFNNLMHLSQSPIQFIVLLHLMMSLPANAASQGQLGSTSTGSVRITLVIPPRLNVISVSTAISTSNNTTHKQICVSGRGIHHYSLTAQGNRKDEEFLLISKQQAAAPLQYNIQAGNTRLNQQYKAAQKHYQTPTDHCLQPTDLKIQLKPGNQENLHSGHYTGSATVTVSAE